MPESWSCLHEVFSRLSFFQGSTLHFCSQDFLIFFGVIFTAYWLLPWRQVRTGLLLAASFYFYACWSAELALLVLCTSVLDYLLALGMDYLASPFWRRALLGASLAVNLGLLAYFKYANFFLHSLEEALRSAGAPTALPVLQVILPVGISFYTFEAINYTVDVYRRKVPAERNPLNLLLFILFFPHLIAGPIVRARDFLPQIRRAKRWDWARLQLGLQFFLLGAVKKMAIADRMALFVDPIFADPAQFETRAVWLATLAYALQIFCDFSGYTDMAIGTAHLLGYKLAANFNMPYLAANVSEFWRRWHMSLSSWLRDYLFIPLGGSRGSRWQTYRNLLATMALGGLWHGANWTFVVWGLLHGVFLVGHRMFQDYCKARPRLDGILQSQPGTAARMGLTFLCVALAWIFFRAPTFSAATEIFRCLLVPHDGRRAPLPYHIIYGAVAVAALSHVLVASGLWKRWAVRLPAPVLGLGYAAVLTLALVLAPEAGKAFIYFQF